MRRLFVVIAATVTVGVGVAAWGTAASAREAGPADATSVEQRKPVLPALPANIKSRGRWNIAVKCDTPPFGYIGARSQNAGFDVEIARYFAKAAFGKANRVTLSCVTTPAREPALTTDRVDLVIATFTYNSDRETRIDFSRAYYAATGRLLVKNGGPLQSLRDMAGKTIATTSGSVYDRWVKNCYKDTKLIITDSFTNALLAFRDGRADALMFDDTILLGIAVTDPTHQADGRPLPRSALRDRHQAGKRRAEALGRLAAQRHEEEGSLPSDPQEHGAAAAGGAVLEEHPEAEPELRLRPGRYHDRVLVAETTIATRRGAAASAAAPPLS